jgi:hypothetical protein
MANEQTSKWQTPTQRRFESFYLANSKTGLSVSIQFLAEVMGKVMTKNLALGYLDTLGTLTQDEAILAFSRVQDEYRVFPAPATLRELSGRAVTGDPIAAEAKDELLQILAAMRGPHGPKLKPILGKILYGTEDCPRDEHGRVHHAPIRAESTPFPLSRRTEAALVRLGWGDRVAGIAVIADHPSLRRKQDSDDERYQQNQLRASDEILKRFVDAYRESIAF